MLANLFKISINCYVSVTQSRKSRPNSVSSSLDELPTVAFYSSVLSDLDAIGWSRVHQLDHSLRRIDFHLTDAAGRAHRVGVILASQHPQQPPSVQLDAPLPLDVPSLWSRLSSSGSGLRSVTNPAGSTIVSAPTVVAPSSSSLSSLPLTAAPSTNVQSPLPILIRECESVRVPVFLF
jgi:hypothetical protein